MGIRRKSELRTFYGANSMLLTRGVPLPFRVIDVLLTPVVRVATNAYLMHEHHVSKTLQPTQTIGHA